MMNSAKNTFFKRLSPALPWALAGAFTLVAVGTQAQVTDLSDKPVTNITTGVVKPNIMVLVDTSGSMSYTHMPDELEGLTGAIPAEMPVGYRAYQCNSLYYNPNVQYKLPKGADGTDLPTPSFTAAPYDYYTTGTTVTTDLTTNFQAFDANTRRKTDSGLTTAGGANDVPGAAYYYVFTPSSGNPTLRYDQFPCTAPYRTSAIDPPVVTGTNGTWTWNRITVSSNSGPGGVDERQNFAIWYTYHRTRLALSKTALSLAFQTLTDQYRLGLITSSPTVTPGSDSPVSDSKFLPISDFGSTHRSNWFSKLFSLSASGSSPTREALARVGRYYGGKTDGINQNMINGSTKQDPVQFACQRNYTFMTTDGYWNTANEYAGPVKLDGTTWVGQQDGELYDPVTGTNAYTPFTVWDGAVGGFRRTTDVSNVYQYASCATGRVEVVDTQISQSTFQARATTTRTERSTSQNLQYTPAITESTAQILQGTRQERAVSTQQRASTNQIRESTNQNLESVFQIRRVVTELRQSTTQRLRSQTQNLESVYQIRQVVTRDRESTTQRLQTRTQTLESVNQIQAISQRDRASTSQITETLTQISRSTSQLTQTRTQTQERKVQQRQYNGATEQDSAVATCTPSATIECYTVDTGWYASGSCTPASASAGNNFNTTTCQTLTLQSAIPVASCSAATGSSGNSWTTTTCDTVTTGPTLVASCSNVAAAAGNNYTATTCSSSVVGPTGVSSCSPQSPASGNNFTQRTCNTVTTTNVVVDTCTPQTAGSGNSWVTRTCNVEVLSTTGVQTCNASSGAAPGFVDTACNTINTSNVPVSSCTAQTGGSGNGWLTRSCPVSPLNTNNLPVQTCTAQTASSGNQWTSIACTNNNTSNVPVATCTAQTATSGNNWVTRTCNVLNVSNVGVQTCTPSSNVGVNFDDTACPVTNTSNVPVQTCTPVTGSSGNQWLTRTCSTNNTSNVPVQTCTAQTATSGNSWLGVTCANNNTGPTAVGSCTASAADAGNNWTATTCSTVTVSDTGVAACTPQAPTAGNGFQTITCPTTNTSNVPVATCTPQTGSAANGFLTRTCSANTTTNVPVASCTAQTANAGNSFVTRTCNTATTGPTPVAACTYEARSAGNSFTETTCSTATSTVGVQSCTPEAASSTNSFTAITCELTDTLATPVAVQTCTPQTAAAGNQWTQINCTPANTSNVAVASCTPQTASAGNNWVTRTCQTTDSAQTGVQTCTPVAPSVGNGFVATLCTTASTGPVGVETCTPAAGNAGNNWVTTVCNPTVSGPTGVASCTPQVASASNNWTGITCDSVSTGPTFVASCTAGTSGTFVQTSCNTAVTISPTFPLAADCTAASPNAGNNFVRRQCNPITGNKLQYLPTTKVTTQITSGAALVGSPSIVETVGTYADANAICYLPNTQPALPAAGRPAAGQLPLPPAPFAAWPTVENVATPVVGGSVNSLADVAQYYYINDLRPSMEDNVFPQPESNFNLPQAVLERDRAPWQHMTTFVMGLGVSGTKNFIKNYKTAPGDFQAIRDGGASWPQWPDPAITSGGNGNYASQSSYNDGRSIDDFWHAASNGRGLYFSAADQTSVDEAVQTFKLAVDGDSGAGGGAATSTLAPVAGDNAAYLAGFTTEVWTGDVEARGIDPVSGLLTSSVRWSARAKLNNKVGDACDNRNIYYFNSSGTNKLSPFTWNTRQCDTTTGLPTGTASTGLTAAAQEFFGADEILALDYQSQMTPTQRTNAAGANLVNFLRGQKQFEGFGPSNNTKLYRDRVSVLGDIVNSQPVFVGVPSNGYQDSGYAAFKTAQASRAPAVYVGANDGMLHAFNAPSDPTDPNGGEELWAYIPNMVMDDLYQLAEIEYSARHKFFVDGSPVVGDIYDSAIGVEAWKTILVSGLGKGGQGYFALDVTDPANPKGLWEFKLGACYGGSPQNTDCQLGFSYGKPIITKLGGSGSDAGTWVVLVTSGLNNVPPFSPSGDGKGYLYVLNAATGQIMYRISTGAGSTTQPSGLKEINTYVSNSAIDNTVERVYGADMLGNIWRFDVNGSLVDASGDPAETSTGARDAVAIAKALDELGVPQPITTLPLVAEFNSKTLVLVGTGRLIGATDLTDTQTQSFYSFVDTLANSTTYTNLRNQLKPVTLSVKLDTVTATGLATERTVACSGTDAQCASTQGWYLDLPDPGERVNVNPVTARGTVAFTSNVPDSSACSIGGYAWVNFLDILTGLAPSTSVGGIASNRLQGNALNVGFGAIRIGNTIRFLARDSSGAGSGGVIPGSQPAPAGRRISWREITAR